MDVELCVFLGLFLVLIIFFRLRSGKVEESCGIFDVNEHGKGSCFE